MSANVETAVYANKPAWHREGTVLDTNGDKGMTIEVALPASGLDWRVTKVPAYGFAPSDFRVKDGKPDYAKGPKANAKPILVPGRYNVVRDTDLAMLGNVGKTWQPVQNIEGFQLIDDLIDVASGGKCRAWIESAGALDGGKKVWVLVHIDSGMQIAGESYHEYLLFTNGHDGRASVAAAVTNVRVVCENTLAFALANNPRVVRVRHTTKATDRIKEARQILNLRDQYTEELAKQGEWLVEQSISDAEFEGFLQTLMPINDTEGEDADSPAATMIRDRRADVLQVYTGAKNLDPIRGTRWGAVQAVAEYADHGRKFTNANTQLKNQFGIVGSGTALKDSAMTILRQPMLNRVEIAKA